MQSFNNKASPEREDEDSRSHDEDEDVEAESSKENGEVEKEEEEEELKLSKGGVVGADVIIEADRDADLGSDTTCIKKKEQEA